MVLGLRKQTTGTAVQIFVRVDIDGRLGENPFDNKSTIGPQAMGLMHHAI